MIRNVQRCLLGGMLAACLFWGIGRAGEAQVGSESDSQAEKIAQFLQEAKVSFDKQEFNVCFELYQRVLVLDPGNPAARENIFALVDMYNTLEELARKEHDLERAEILNQQQREMTRYLLKILTSQLESSIQTYREYKTFEKDGQEVKSSILPVLENIITVLTELKAIYEDVSGNKERTKQMVERISKTLETYENELTYYSELE